MTKPDFHSNSQLSDCNNSFNKPTYPYAPKHKLLKYHHNFRSNFHYFLNLNDRLNENGGRKHSFGSLKLSKESNSRKQIVDKGLLNEEKNHYETNPPRKAAIKLNTENTRVYKRNIETGSDSNVYDKEYSNGNCNYRESRSHIDHNEEDKLNKNNGNKYIMSNLISGSNDNEKADDNQKIYRGHNTNKAGDNSFDSKNEDDAEDDDECFDSDPELSNVGVLDFRNNIVVKNWKLHLFKCCFKCCL